MAATPSPGGGEGAGGPRYARVIVDVRPAHLDRPFDYRIPDGVEVAVGQRVRVAFAGRRRTGWVVGVGDDTDADPSKVRELALVQGSTRWFDEADLELYRWVAQRWAGTLADVLRHGLPPRVAAIDREAEDWPEPPAPPGPSDSGPSDSGPSDSGSPDSGPAPAPPALAPAAPAWEGDVAEALLAALDRGPGDRPPAVWWRPLPDEDVAAALAQLTARALAAGSGVVAVSPDPRQPALDAIVGVAEDAAADWRGAGDRARHRAFLRGRRGFARVAVGERGAVFAPVGNLGLVVVLDEANPAYKERRSPRFHARDVALARARMAGAAAVVVGDLPSAALWRLLREGHVAALRPSRAAETARAPRVDVVDLADPRPQPRARLARPADRALGEAVSGGRAAIVLASRRGEGAAVACTRCGHRHTCPRCDGSLAAEGPQRRCPTCGWQGSARPCPECGETGTAPLAAGAERLAAEIGRAHPEADVVAMEGYDAPGPTRRPAIAVMTRGSVVADPAWLGGERAAVLVVPDADALRARPSLEAGEDALRLWMDAARLAERVVLQTRVPGDVAVQALVRSDPDGFWEREAQWRAELGFPPARSLVRVEAGAAGREVAGELRSALEDRAEVLGPDPDGALLVKTADLRGTLRALAPLRAEWGRTDRGVRLDVDPVPAG